MTNNTSTCTAHNGTYTCALPAGHEGQHRGTIRYGLSRGIRYAFADQYSQVKFTGRFAD